MAPFIARHDAAPHTPTGLLALLGSLWIMPNNVDAQEKSSMPATEIQVTSAGMVAGKELLIPTGEEGGTLPHVQDWVTRKLKAKSAVKDVSTSVLVKGIKQWSAYEEKVGSKKTRTVFKIT